jgi:HEAT repeat protein
LIRALDDPELTADAANALGRIGDSRAYEKLLALLSSDRGAVRRAAIAALNSIGHVRMRKDVQGLLIHKNPRIRESAFELPDISAIPMR